LHAFTFTSLSAAQCAEIKAKKWDVGEKQGIAVVTSHAGSLANISGVADGDIITAVNNVVWDSQNPKRSFQRLHNELKAGRPTLTLLVIPARR
jgi:S1-C subfamily serine protease